MRRGFSLIEVLLAMGIGLMLIALAWEGSSSANRVLTRGQDKLTDTGQAELVFRWLEQDTHAGAQAPVIAPDGLGLAVVRYIAAGGPDPLAKRRVAWTFKPGTNGDGSYVERTVEGQPPTRFVVGALSQASLKAFGTAPRAGLVVKLTMKQLEDNTPAEFTETFLYQNQIVDPAWNPLEL